MKTPIELLIEDAGIDLTIPGVYDKVNQYLLLEKSAIRHAWDNSGFHESENEFNEYWKTTYERE